MYDIFVLNCKKKKKSGSAKVANFLAINLPVFISGYVTNHLSPTFNYHFD